MKLMNKERTTIPHISTIQKLLITVEIMFITLRLSRFFTQIIESTSPKKTERIFTPAQMELTLSVNVILNKVGTNVAKGKMLKINAATLNFCNFLFSITYLISFFPKRVIATVSTNVNIKIAHGKNGNRLKPVLIPSAVKSCREQETK